MFCDSQRRHRRQERDWQKSRRARGPCQQGGDGEAQRELELAGPFSKMRRKSKMRAFSGKAATRANHANASQRRRRVTASIAASEQRSDVNNTVKARMREGWSAAATDNRRSIHQEVSAAQRDDPGQPHARHKPAGLTIQARPHARRRPNRDNSHAR